MHLQLLQKPFYEARGLVAAPSYYVTSCEDPRSGTVIGSPTPQNIKNQKLILFTYQLGTYSRKDWRGGGHRDSTIRFLNPANLRRQLLNIKS